LGLAYLAALGTVERDRRELSLLRARGVSRRWLVSLAVIASLFVGIVAGILGSGIALLALRLVHVGRGPLTLWRVVATVGGCVVLAVLGAAAARLGAGAAALRGEVAEGRRPQRPRRPLWQRLYLDVLALAVSGLVYWLTARTGFSAVVNPDSNPTLSLSVYMFLAPALLWLGATLLLVRARGTAVAWIARKVAGTRATTLRDSYFLGGSASQMLARLRARADGILVSRETVTDYSLAIGDLLKLRVLDRRTGNFRVAPFHVVGVVQEFPSAPRDSFM